MRCGKSAKSEKKTQCATILVVMNFGAVDDGTFVESTNVRITFAASERFYILEVSSILHENFDDANRRSVASGPIHRSAHENGFPFSSQANLATGGTREREPFDLFFLGFEKVIKRHIDEAESGVGSHAALVHHLNAKNGRGSIGDQALGGVLPCRGDCAFECTGSTNLFALEHDAGVGVDLTVGIGLLAIEVFGLMDGKANNTRRCEWCKSQLNCT